MAQLSYQNNESSDFAEKNSFNANKKGRKPSAILKSCSNAEGMTHRFPNTARSNVKLDRDKLAKVLLLQLCESYLTQKIYKEAVPIACKFLELIVPHELMFKLDNSDLYQLIPFVEITFYDFDKYEDAKKNFCLALYFLNKTHEAIEIFKSITDNKQEQIQTQMSDLLNELIDLESAHHEKLKFCEYIINNDSQNSLSYLNQGWHLFQLKRYHDAIAAYKKCIDLNQYESRCYYGLGGALRELKQYWDAIDAYKKCVDLDPNHTSVWSDLAKCLSEVGYYKEVIEAYKNNLRISPGDVRVKQLLCIDLFLQSNKEEVSNYFDSLSAGAQNYVLLAVLFFSKGTANYSCGLMAAENLLIYLKENVWGNEQKQMASDIINLPEEESIYWYKAWFLERLGRPKEAAMAYTQYISNRAGNVNELHQLSTQYHRAEEYDKSVQICNNALEFEIDNIISKQLLFCSLYLSGKKEKALSLFVSFYLEDQITALECLIEDFLGLKRYSSAFKIILQLLELDPNNLLGHFYKTLCFIGQNKNCDALASYNEFYQIACDYGDSYQPLYESLVYIWRYPGSFIEWEKNLLESNIAPLISMFQLLKATFLWQEGKKEESVEYVASNYFELNKIIEPKPFDFLFACSDEVVNEEEMLSNKEYILNFIIRKIHDNQLTDKSNLQDRPNQILEISKFFTKIINAYKLYEDKHLIYDSDEINNDLTFNNRSGLFILPRQVQQKEMEHKDTLVAYDVLYYSLIGSKYILDYTRSFIAPDTPESVSLVLNKIRDSYRSLHGFRKPMEAHCAPMVRSEINIHNTLLVDNYAWMGDEINYKAVIDTHVDVENKYVEEFLADQKSSVNYLKEELQDRIELEYDTSLGKICGYEYYVRYEKDQGLPIYHRISFENNTKGLNPKEEIILDFNKLNAKKPFVHISDVFISETHNLLAYGVDYTGNESFEIKIIDLNTKEHKNDVVTNVCIDTCPHEPCSFIWHNKVAGFFYYDRSLDKVRFHKIGDNQNKDSDILINQDKDDELYLLECSSKEFALICKNHKIRNNEVYLLSLNDATLEAYLTIPKCKDFHYQVEHNRDYIYARINDVGNNFRVIRATLSDIIKGRGNWEEYISQDENRYLRSFSISKNYLILNYLNNGLAEIEFVRLKDKKAQMVTFPVAAYNAYGRVSNYKEDGLSIYYSSFMDTKITYSYNFNQNKMTIKGKIGIRNINQDDYEVKRVWASNNGVNIPISLFYKKSLLRMDGSNPLYLFGYGSGGINCNWREYRSSVLSLVDRGFIYAMAHVRGGDELGYDWWRESIKLNHPNRFKDFITCAEFLIREKYTRAGNIVAAGRSAGGKLVTVAANMRPELFKAIIPANPSLDFINHMLELKSKNNCHIEEYGDPRDQRYFESMLTYCPYMSIEKNPYPSVYIINGVYDWRIGYYEPLKWVAKLREHKINDSPILIRTKKVRGHFYPSNRFDLIEEIAEEYTFIFKVFGIEVVDNKYEPRQALPKTISSDQSSLDDVDIVQSILTSTAYDNIFKIFSTHAIESTGIDGFNEEPVAFEIRQNGKTLAILVAQVWWGKFHIKYLVVEKEARGQGLGTKLMQHALDYAKAQGCKSAFLESMNFHKPEFYHKFGFETDYIHEGYDKNTSFYHMSKML